MVFDSRKTNFIAHEEHFQRHQVHKSKLLKYRECVRKNVSFTRSRFPLLRPKIVDHQLGDDDKSAIDTEISKPVTSINPVKSLKDIESKDDDEKKKDKSGDG